MYIYTYVLKVEVGRVPYAPMEELADSDQQKLDMDEQRIVTPEGYVFLYFFIYIYIYI
jgi:hypothetical protein